MLDDREVVCRKIEEIAAPLAKALHLELVGVTCHGRGPGAVVRITIDKPGGVGVQDCERLHHSLSRALEVVDSIAGAYRLEVSSPGLDRPITKPEEFRKAIGKMVRMKLRAPVQGCSVLVGRLTGVEASGIEVAVRSKNRDHSLHIEWEMIRSTRLEPEW